MAGKRNRSNQSNVTYKDVQREEILRELPPKLSSCLMPFQKEGVVFAVNKNARCLIADEMGLGKTLQAIAVAAYYKAVWPLLIIVPSSLRYVWIEELEKWQPDVLPHEINLIHSGFDTAGIEHARITLVTYGLLSCKSSTTVKEALIARNFSFVICDESHYFKNSRTECCKAVTPLLKSARHCILLSGTPALAKPAELYTQLDALQPGKFGSWWSFTRRYCDAHWEHFGRRRQWRADGASNLEELQKHLQTLMIRREKDSVLTQLPPKQRQKILFQLKDSQTKKEIMTQFAELKPLLKKSTSSLASALTGRENNRSQGKENRNSTGEEKDTSILARIQRLYKLAAEAKIGPAREYIQMLCENASLKFLVFAYHHCVMDGIQQTLWDKKVKFVRIDGTTKPSDRQLYVQQFQNDGDTQVAILSVLAAGVGLTLTAAKLVVFAELYWTPGVMVQCEDRAHRIGQSSALPVHYLVARDTMDEWVWSAVCRKTLVTSTALTGKTKALQASAGDPCQVELLSAAEAYTPSETVDIDISAFLQSQLPSDQKSILDFFSSQSESSASQPEKPHPQTTPNNNSKQSGLSTSACCDSAVNTPHSVTKHSTKKSTGSRKSSSGSSFSHTPQSSLKRSSKKSLSVSSWAHAAIVIDSSDDESAFEQRSVSSKKAVTGAAKKRKVAVHEISDSSNSELESCDDVLPPLVKRKRCDSVKTEHSVKQNTSQSASKQAASFDENSQAVTEKKESVEADSEKSITSLQEVSSVEIPRSGISTDKTSCIDVMDEATCEDEISCNDLAVDEIATYTQVKPSSTSPRKAVDSTTSFPPAQSSTSTVKKNRSLKANDGQGKAASTPSRTRPQASVSSVTSSEYSSQAHTNGTVQENETTEWNCSVCTFSNNGLLPFCEMCETPRKKKERLKDDCLLETSESSAVDVGKENVKAVCRDNSVASESESEKLPQLAVRRRSFGRSKHSVANRSSDNTESCQERPSGTSSCVQKDSSIHSRLNSDCETHTNHQLTSLKRSKNATKRSLIFGRSHQGTVANSLDQEEKTVPHSSRTTTVLEYDEITTHAEEADGDDASPPPFASPDDGISDAAGSGRTGSQNSDVCEDHSETGSQDTDVFKRDDTAHSPGGDMDCVELEDSDSVSLFSSPDSPSTQVDFHETDSKQSHQKMHAGSVCYSSIANRNGSAEEVLHTKPGEGLEVVGEDGKETSSENWKWKGKIYNCFQFCCSTYTGRVYIFDEDGQSLGANFQPLDVELNNLDSLPDLLHHPIHLRTVQTFVRQWNSLTDTKRRLISKRGLLFRNPLAAYDSVRTDTANNKQRYVTKEDQAQSALKKASELNGHVRVISKHRVTIDISSTAIEAGRKPSFQSSGASEPAANSPHHKGFVQVMSAEGVPLCLQCQAPCTSLLSHETVTHSDNAWHTRFCSRTCADAHWMKTNTAYLRSSVYDIQHGVCQLCQFDAHIFFCQIRDTSDLKQRAEMIGKTKYSGLGAKLKKQMVSKPNEGLFWHVDHIRPVWEGGGQCDIDNLRTLCTPCHSSVTARQATKRAQARRLSKAAFNGDITAFFQKS